MRQDTAGTWSRCWLRTWCDWCATACRVAAGCRARRATASPCASSASPATSASNNVGDSYTIREHCWFLKVNIHAHVHCGFGRPYGVMLFTCITCNSLSPADVVLLLNINIHNIYYICKSCMSLTPRPPQTEHKFRGVLCTCTCII